MVTEELYAVDIRFRADRRAEPPGTVRKLLLSA